MINLPERKETILDKIKHWWSYTKTYHIEIPVNDFINGIKNLIKWHKVVWEDRNWGYSSILSVLKFKLEDTQKYYIKLQKKQNAYMPVIEDDFCDENVFDENISDRFEDKIKYINICIRLIERIWPTEMNFDIKGYEHEFSDYYENEMHWLPVTESDYTKEELDLMSDKFKTKLMECSRIESTQLWEKFDDYFALNKLSYKKAVEFLKNNDGCGDPDRKFSIASRIGIMKREKAINLLFKIMAQKIDHWWD